MFTGTEELHSLFLDHPLAVTDSRQIKPSCIFFALRGGNFDGNRYASEALEKGAAYAVVDDPRYKTSSNILLVEDVLKTVQDLATHHRLQYDIPVIAITGSNGKTTTKELTDASLSKNFQVMATAGNLNNHIGVPLTLLRINSKTRIAIIEMGANHPGEIDFLCRIARPGYGLITNIGKAHLEGFGGYEGVIRTKTEMYRFLEETGGKVFVNGQDPLLMEHSNKLSRFIYRLGKGEGVCGQIITAREFVSVRLFSNDSELAVIDSGLFGEYNALNILAAACIGLHFQVPATSIASAIGEYTPSNNRSQVKKTEKNILILDAYNANPSSMDAALRHFAVSSFNEKAVILGDMLELGEESDELHMSILRLLEELSFSEVYLVGPVFTRLNVKREYLCFEDSALARLWFEHHAPASKTILLKGSRGIRLESVAEVL
jgi:UDP-N-acetylmuramoyl-tripeptide--D-alanyl-D-alanine ligase